MNFWNAFNYLVLCALQASRFPGKLPYSDYELSSDRSDLKILSNEVTRAAKSWQAQTAVSPAGASSEPRAGTPPTASAPRKRPRGSLDP